MQSTRRSLEDTSNAQTPSPRLTPRGRTAVVVDDDPATQKLMIRSLEQIHVRAQGFPDGESALDHLKATKTLPDVIAIDLQLPRMSGAELAQEIRNDPRLAPI